MQHFWNKAGTMINCSSSKHDEMKLMHCGGFSRRNLRWICVFLHSMCRKTMILIMSRDLYRYITSAYRTNLRYSILILPNDTCVSYQYTEPSGTLFSPEKR